MRVILLTQYYSPEPPFRPAELAPILKQRGYDVTVITGFPNYPYGKLYSGYRQRLWQWEEREGVRILRLPLFPDHSQSSIRRALYFLSFAASAAIIGPLLCGKADAMHVYNDPNLGIPAFLISKLRGVPYVLEVADIWPESLSAGEMVKNQRVLRWVTKLVQFTCQHAAAVVVVSPGFKNNLVKKGIPSEKIRYIPNWGDDSIYRPVEPDLALAEKTGLAGHFNVLYAGNMGVAQGLHAVIEAAEHLRDLPDVQFVFIGDGVEKSDLERMVAEKHLINVRFLDRQSPEKMPDFYALADVLLAHLKQNPLFDITIPSKTLPYLASGKPILMAVAGDAADVVSKAMAGITCEPENPGAIAAAVRQLRAMSPEARQRLGHAGRQAFLKFYARDVLIGTWEQLFVDIALRPR